MMNTRQNGDGRDNEPSIVFLDESRARDSMLTGSKASNLATLVGEDYEIPHGFVVTTKACRLIEESNGQLPDDLHEQIEAALQELGEGSSAVRSSAVSEDLAGSSYAGQYETFLDVRGVDEVCNAVARCIEAASADRIDAYERARGEESEGDMAVLVQRFVDADAAGVAFSANPVTGERDETIVSVVEGTGERLVSGEADAQDWVVEQGSARCQSGGKEIITAEQVSNVAELADKLEERFGTPQDVEWAWKDDVLHLLQVRPITALPRAPEYDIPEGVTLQKDVVHYPEQLTPFGASMLTSQMETAIAEVASTFGLLLDGFKQHCIGGEIYTQAVPLGGKQGPAPPWWVIGILSRVHPAFRKRMAAARRVIRSGLLESLPKRWNDEWRSEFKETCAQMRTVELQALSDEELVEHLDEAIELLDRGHKIHFELFVPYVVALCELTSTCRQLLGWDLLKALELVDGLSTFSSEPTRALGELADELRHNSDARQVIERGGADVVERLREVAPEAADAFEEYCEEYGWRTPNYDSGARALAERPELLASLLADAFDAAPVDEVVERLSDRRAAAEEEALKQLADESPDKRRRFKEVLKRAREVYGLREDNVCWTGNAPCAVIRRITKEFGRRLAQRGLLRRAEDVVYLHADKVRRCLNDDRGFDPVEIADDQRAQWAWTAVHPGPPHFGPAPEPPPDMRGLPAEGRRINRAMTWIMDHEFGTPPEPTTGDLSGVPASAGKYTGAVRVIRSEAEFDRFKPGEVLVCPVTTPSWSILFGTAGALVTDGGGMVSHAAIVAREHGIPAVLNTRTATQDLEDGQIVTVDASTGTVRIESPSEKHTPSAAPARASMS